MKALRLQPPHKPNSIPIPKDRLKNALRSIMAANNQLRVDINQFRHEMDKLNKTVKQLEKNLPVYRCALGGVDFGVSRLGRKSRRLSRIMAEYRAAE